MQYSITLPADYDMAIIRQRIASKGHAMNGFPDLAHKVFAYATRDTMPGGNIDNLYAPFYLWDSPAGMNQFLTGEGFAVLSRDFGRPRVQLWSVLAARSAPGLRASRWATRDTLRLPRNADLRVIASAATDGDAAALAGATATILAFDPGEWTLVRLRLWQDRPAAGLIAMTGPAAPAGSAALAEIDGPYERQIYEVGYVASSG